MRRPPSHHLWHGVLVATACEYNQVTVFRFLRSLSTKTGALFSLIFFRSRKMSRCNSGYLTSFGCTLVNHFPPYAPIASRNMQSVRKRGRAWKGRLKYPRIWCRVPATMQAQAAKTKASQFGHICQESTCCADKGIAFAWSVVSRYQHGLLERGNRGDSYAIKNILIRALPWAQRTVQNSGFSEDQPRRQTLSALVYMV